ncbi:hypothetical protein CYY_006229 [Polysphondylium violaceum]|uniref:Follistatin-like domain-containing protein n=1 Tax=Polysphondylium violaceum TaxID=133409 RepID=A0A8J4PQV6_9MYCE|nr:hypothetical protein CYY_006229 [Polysphondylium violaceum]
MKLNYIKIINILWIFGIFGIIFFPQINAIDNNNNDNSLDSEIIIYNDYLESGFKDHSSVSFTSSNALFDLENKFPTYNNSKNSIHFKSLHLLDGFEFITNQFTFNSSFFSYLSFKIYTNNTQPPQLIIQFTNDGKEYGPTKSLLSTINLKSLPINEWINAKLPLPLIGNYNGFRIYHPDFQDIQQGSDIFIDLIKIHYSESYLLYKESIKHQILKLNNRRNLLQVLDDSSQALTTLIKNYHVYSAQADRSLGGDSGGHSFWTPEQNNLLNNQLSWDFDGDSGILSEYSNGKLILTGTIHSIQNPSDCSSFWKIYFEFEPVENYISNRKELGEFAYVPMGFVDPSTWKYYRPILSNSKWIGNGCNTEQSVLFNGLQYDMLMQMGVGANGKNGNLGISVWLLYSDKKLIDINIDLVNRPIEKIQQQIDQPLSQPINYNEPLGCENVHCPLDYYCQVKNDGKRYCLSNPIKPTPQPISYSTPQPIVLIQNQNQNQNENICSRLDCPKGFYCTVSNGIGYCNETSSSLSSCNEFNCPKGYQCKTHYKHKQAFKSCEPLHCSQVSCPRGYECFICPIQGIPKCKKITLTCDDVYCPKGYECHVCHQTGQPKCKRDFQTCDDVYCPKGYECHICKESGLPKCRPITPPCHNVKCARGYICSVTDDFDTVCIPDVPTCEDVLCPRGYDCIHNKKQQLKCRRRPDCGTSCLPGYQCVVMGDGEECLLIPPPRNCFHYPCDEGYVCKYQNDTITPICVPQTNPCLEYSNIYDISGYLWFDNSADGVKNVFESTFIQNAYASLLNPDLSNARDLYGNIIPASKTNNVGSFSFKNIVPGQFIIRFGNVPQGYTWSPSMGFGDSTSWVLSNGMTPTFTLFDNLPPPSINKSLDTIPLGSNRVVKSISIIDPFTPDRISGKCTVHFSINSIVGGLFAPTPFISTTSSTFGTTTSSTTGASTTTISMTTGPVTTRSSISTAPPTPTPGTTSSTFTTGTPTPIPTNRVLAIGKRVFIDSNGNGIFDQGDLPVPGVNIYLYNDKNQLVASTNTDFKGMYYFDKVPSGYYYVQLSSLPFGYVLSSLNKYPTDQTNTTGIFGVLVGSPGMVNNNNNYPVTASLIRPDVDFGLIEKSQTYAVGDQVWIDPDRNGVLDAGERGVNGIKVTLLPQNGGSPQTTFTDHNGNYYFDNLPPGKYKIEFGVPPGYIITNGINSASKTTAVFELSPTSPKVHITLPTESLEAKYFNDKEDLGLYYTPTYAIGRFVWNDLNGDGVYQSNEPFINGVQVSIMTSSGGPVTDIFGETVKPVKTDDSGRYLFDFLKNEEYIVTFTPPPGFNPSPVPSSGPSRVNSYADPTTHRTPPISLASFAEPTTVSDRSTGAKASLIFPNANAGFFKPDTYSVGDLIWYDLNQNGFVDADEPGVPNVKAILYDFDNQIAKDVDGKQIAPIYTDANGRFMFSNLKAGFYHIGFSELPQGYKWTEQRASGNFDLSLFDSRPNEATGITENFILRKGFQETRFSLPSDDVPDPYINDYQDGGLIPGTIEIPEIYAVGRYVWYDDNDNAIRDQSEVGTQFVTIKLLTPTLGVPTYLDGSPILPTKTDRNGKYIFDNIPPGDYIVEFSNIPNGYTFIDGPWPYPNRFTGRTTPFRLSKARSVPNDPSSLHYNKLIRKLLELYASDSSLEIPNPFGSASDVSGSDLAIPNPFGSASDVSSSSSIDSTSSLANEGAPLSDAGPPGTSLKDINPGGAVTYETFVENLPGFNLASLIATRLDPTRNAGIIKSLSYGFGNLVFYKNEIDEVVGVKDVTITLTDDQGNPVVDLSGAVVAPVLTKSDGTYSFDNLRPGQYIATFSTIPPGFSFFNPPLGKLNFTLDVSSPDVRTSVPSDNAPRSKYFNPNVDQELSVPNVYGIGDFVWYDTDQDGIYNANGSEKPVQGLTVSLQDVDGNSVYNRYGLIVQPIKTDIDGKYFFDNLPSGQYVVKFDKLDGYIFTLQRSHEPLPGLFSVSSSPDSKGLTGVIDLSPSSPYLMFPPIPGMVATVGDFNIDAGLVPSSTVIVPYAIGNYAWKDLNNNGIKDPGEPPVPNVTVTLIKSDGSIPKDINGNVIPPTKTDANGKYFFDNVPSGTYRVQFTDYPNDLMFSDQTKPIPSTGRTPSFGLYPTYPNVREATPTDGVQATYVDFTENAAFVDLKTVAVGRYVWTDLNSNGIREANEPPAVGITLYLYDENNNKSLVSTRITNDQGFYYFDELKPGVYTISLASFLQTWTVTKPNAGNGTNDSKAINNEISKFRLSPFSSKVKPTDPSKDPVKAPFIDRDENIGILKPFIYSVGRRVWYDDNQDSIMDSNEKGVEGVTVSLKNIIDASPSNYSYDLYHNPLVATTNKTGDYWIDCIPPGRYIAQFSNVPKDYKFTKPLADSVPNDLGNYFPVELLTNGYHITPFDPKIDIGAKNPDYVNHFINAGIIKSTKPLSLFAISGFAFYDPNENDIMEAGETGVAGISVQLLDSLGNNAYNSKGVSVPVATTDENGQYRFDSLLSGNYSIQFIGSPYKYEYTIPNSQLDVHSANITGDLLFESNPKVRPSIPSDGVVANFTLPHQDKGIKLTPTYAVGDQVILDYRDTTLSNGPFKGQGITVSLSQDGMPAVDFDSNLIDDVVTDANGYYLFDNVPSGNYTVTFSNIPDDWFFSEMRNSSDPYSRTFSIDFFLPNAQTVLSSTIPKYSGVVARFVDPTEDVLLVPLLLAIGDLTFIDLNLSGTQGNPIQKISNITVELLNTSLKPVLDAYGNTVKPIQSDSDGLYLFDDLYPGKYVVRFGTAPGYSFTDQYTSKDETFDSNPNPSGLTSTIDLRMNGPNVILFAPDNRTSSLAWNPTIDAGYVENNPTGYISGLSFIDYNADGIFNKLDTVFPNITVNLVDRGVVIQSTKTDLGGLYAFSGLDIGKQYQVFFSDIPQGFYPTVPVAKYAGSQIQYPTATQTDVNVGLLNPDQYCQDNPKIFVACFTKPMNASEPVLISIDYNAYSTPDNSGPSFPKTMMADNVQQQSVYGVAYDKVEDYIYSATYKKAGAAVNLRSTIYRVKQSKPMVSEVFLRLDDIYGNGWALRESAETLSYMTQDQGDIEIVGDYLYVAVLNKTTVAKIPLRVKPTINNIILIKMTHNCGPDNYRIFGLGWDGVNMFVGGICDGMNTKTIPTGLVTRIESDDKTLTDVLSFSFGYPRGYIQKRTYRKVIISGIILADWKYWVSNTTITGGLWPHPHISDITFIGNQGNMILSIIDREADAYQNTPAGDMLYACKDATGVYQLELGGTCGALTGSTTFKQPNMLGQGPGNGEFFNDNFLSSATSDVVWQHDETHWSSSVYIPGSSEVVGNFYDLYDINQAILKHHSVSNGSALGGVLIFTLIPTTNFGKLNGLGDMALNCAIPPTYIGNFVWDDLNKDGVQDSYEEGLAGVKVDLYFSNGTLIDSTTTSDKGTYSFLISKGSYRLHFNPPPGYVVSPIATSSGISPVPVVLVNNQANDNGDIIFTVDNYGVSNMNYDAGFYKA